MYELFSPDASFEWIWRGSGLPFVQRGGDFNGAANVFIPPSAYWWIDVTPDANTTILINLSFPGTSSSGLGGTGGGSGGTGGGSGAGGDRSGGGRRRRP
jgi:hypothetical protein